MSKQSKNKNKKSADDDIDLDKLLEEEIARNAATAAVSNPVTAKNEVSSSVDTKVRCSVH